MTRFSEYPIRTEDTELRCIARFYNQTSKTKRWAWSVVILRAEIRHTATGHKIVWRNEKALGTFKNDGEALIWMKKQAEEGDILFLPQAYAGGLVAPDLTNLLNPPPPEQQWGPGTIRMGVAQVRLSQNPIDV